MSLAIVAYTLKRGADMTESLELRVRRSRTWSEEQKVFISCVLKRSESWWYWETESFGNGLIVEFLKGGRILPSIYIFFAKKKFRYTCNGPKSAKKNPLSIGREGLKVGAWSQAIFHLTPYIFKCNTWEHGFHPDPTIGFGGGSGFFRSGQKR